jgi:hypothetical protein
MGLLTGLATLPLAPVRGVAWIAEQVAEEADRQLYDEGSIRRDMLQLELEYEDGEISQARRAAWEEDARASQDEVRASEAEEEGVPGDG